MELRKFKKAIEKIRTDLEDDMYYDGICTGLFKRLGKYPSRYAKEDLREIYGKRNCFTFWWSTLVDIRENSPRLIGLDLFELIVIEEKLYKRY